MCACILHVLSYATIPSRGTSLAGGAGVPRPIPFPVSGLHRVKARVENSCIPRPSDWGDNQGFGLRCHYTMLIYGQPINSIHALEDLESSLV